MPSIFSFTFQNSTICTLIRNFAILVKRITDQKEESFVAIATGDVSSSGLHLQPGYDCSHFLTQHPCNTLLLGWGCSSFCEETLPYRWTCSIVLENIPSFLMGTCPPRPPSLLPLKEQNPAESHKPPFVMWMRMDRCERTWLPLSPRPFRTEQWPPSRFQSNRETQSSARSRL